MSKTVMPNKSVVLNVAHKVRSHFVMTSMVWVLTNHKPRRGQHVHHCGLRSALYNAPTPLCHCHQRGQDAMQHNARSNVVVFALTHQMPQQLITINIVNGTTKPRQFQDFIQI
jgi:hypothetical protein